MTNQEILKSLGEDIKYQTSCLLFSVVLNQKDEKIYLKEKTSPNEILKHIKIKKDVWNDFKSFRFPKIRDKGEISLTNEMHHSDLIATINTIRIHKSLSEEDWFLYEIYCKKIRMLSMDNILNFEILKIFELNNHFIFLDEPLKNSVKVDVKIYAQILRRNNEDDLLIYSPIVNLFAEIEPAQIDDLVEKNQYKENHILRDVNQGYIKVSDLSIGLSLSESKNIGIKIEELVIAAFKENFINVVNGEEEKSLDTNIPKLYHQTFWIHSLILDSFKKFSSDPLSTYINAMKADYDKLRIILFVLNLLFPNIDQFTYVDTDVYTPATLKSRIATIRKIVEVSTVTYLSPGSVITIDDYSDPEIKEHLNNCYLYKKYDEIDFNYGGPRNELAYHLLFMLRISAQTTLITHYQKLVLDIVRKVEKNKVTYVNTVREIRSLIEDSLGEISGHNLALFKFPDIESEYRLILQINYVHNYFEDLLKNLDIFSQWAIEEQRYEQIQSQAIIQNQQIQILNDLKDLLNDNRKLTKILINLTWIIISFSAISVLVALIFYLHIL